MKRRIVKTLKKLEIVKPWDSGFSSSESVDGDLFDWKTRDITLKNIAVVESLSRPTLPPTNTPAHGDQTDYTNMSVRQENLPENEQPNALEYTECFSDSQIMEILNRNSGAENSNQIESDLSDNRL